MSGQDHGWAGRWVAALVCLIVGVSLIVYAETGNTRLSCAIAGFNLLGVGAGSLGALLKGWRS